MNRNTIDDRLARARKDVLELEGHVKRQQSLIGELLRRGESTTTALRSLRTLEDSLTLHTAARDRLSRQHARLSVST